MPQEKQEKLHTGDASGVSEVIGAVLLISLVVAVVAVVSVFLFSQATPQKVPNVNFMTGTDNAGKLYLYHNGGDSLAQGTFSVFIDNNPTPAGYQISGGGTVWSLGENLVITSPVDPSATHSVTLVYNGSVTGPVVIRSSSSSRASLWTNISPEVTLVLPSSSGGSAIPPSYINASDPQAVINVLLANATLVGDAMNQSPQTIGPVVADVVGANSTNFYREGRTTINRNTYFLFKINSTGSTFSYDNPSVKSLSEGDIIVITQADIEPGSWKIFGLGDQIWEFSAEKVNVAWKKKSTGLWTNTSSTTLYHAWITEYNDLGSTLTVSTTSGVEYTALYRNGPPPLILGDSSQTVVLSNIRPVGIGLFVLEYDSNSDSMYFVGNPTTVTVS